MSTQTPLSIKDHLGILPGTFPLERNQRMVEWGFRILGLLLPLWMGNANRRIENAVNIELIKLAASTGSILMITISYSVPVYVTSISEDTSTNAFIMHHNFFPS